MEQNYSSELLVKIFEEYHLPFIEQFISLHSIENILEIGDGSSVCSQLWAKGKCKVVNIDINKVLSQISREKTFEKEMLKLLEDSIISKKDESLFDLILVDELIMHLGERKEMICRIMDFLEPHGIIFVSFKPWYTPFSGCRKIGKNPILHTIPFIHLLPGNVYSFLLKYCFKENLDTINKLLRIKKNTLSVERFRRFIHEEEFLIKAERLYLISPLFSLRYNLKPVELMELCRRIPYLRNILSSYCSYVLTKNVYYFQVI